MRTCWGYAQLVVDLLALTAVVAVAPDGRLALSASDDLTLKLWDVNRGREVDDIDLSPSLDFA